MSELTSEAAANLENAPFQIIEGIQPAAWKALIYGAPGVGKSSLGAFAPSPLFIDLENGLARVNCAKTPKLSSMEEVKDALRYVVQSQKYKTAVIDTIDELEKLLTQKVLLEWNAANKVKAKTLADIPYGRGGDLIVNEWRNLIEVFNILVERGKNVLLIGHEQVVKFENPTDANYDFFTVNIHKKAAPVVMAKLDAVLFARFEAIVKESQSGKGKAVATGERVLMTNQGASWIAKNRFQLPERMPLDGKLFESFV